MKVLTLKDPWGSFVAWGEKRIETRSWAPPQNAIDDPTLPIAIHISAKLDPADRYRCADEPFRSALTRHGVRFQAREGPTTRQPAYWEDPVGLLPVGHIVATCTVVAVERMAVAEIPPRIWAQLYQDKTWNYKQERAFGYWAPGRFAWLLADVRLLPTPIPAKGALGLWEWDPPADLATWLDVTQNVTG